jgi:membrane protease subunit HflC
VTALILIAIAAFMTTYTVRFTESAVVTTFGRADETSVVTEPGLKFRLPYPFQSVTKYDIRSRFVESRPETQQTADEKQVIVTAFMTYRVANPLKFLQAFSGSGSRAETHYRAAETQLQGKLRSAMSQLSQFQLKQLFSTDAAQGGLAEAEKRIFTYLTAKTPESPSLADYGIEPLAVGISSIKLPEQTSDAVFRRMQQTRVRIAQEAQSRGSAEAERIRSEAESDKQKILAFAERRAKSIRGQGEKEAAEYLAKQSSDPELAVFLKNLEFMRDAMAKKVTLVLPTSLPGLGLFQPDALKGLAPGQLPRVDLKNAPAAPAKSENPKDEAKQKMGGGQ